MITPTTLQRLERHATRAKAIMAREQERGLCDLRVKQTRTMAQSVAHAMKHVGAYRRALQDMALEEARQASIAQRNHRYAIQVRSERG